LKEPPVKLLTLFSWEALLLGGMLAAFMLGAVVRGVRWNHTPSVPVGLYMASKNGQFLEFCPSEPWAGLSVARDYRPAAVIGGCPDRRQPLLKRIVGEPGDIIFYDEQGVWVNGQPVKQSKPSAKDTAGRPLEHFAWGFYDLKPGQYWVMGDHPMSFDSRYFGPVDVVQIRNRLKPL
jgi:conjugative transfer signal peptidase TraF